MIGPAINKRQLCLLRWASQGTFEVSKNVRACSLVDIFCLLHDSRYILFFSHFQVIFEVGGDCQDQGLAFQGAVRPPHVWLRGARRARLLGGFERPGHGQERRGK